MLVISMYACKSKFVPGLVKQKSVVLRQDPVGMTGLCGKPMHTFQASPSTASTDVLLTKST